MYYKRKRKRNFEKLRKCLAFGMPGFLFFSLSFAMSVASNFAEHFSLTFAIFAISCNARVKYLFQR